MQPENANYEYLLGLINPTSLVYRKKGFNWSDLREDVANGDYYYSFVSPSKKSTVIYNRLLDCAEGEVRLDIIVSPTSFTAGISSPATNLYIGSAGAETQITRGATNVVGGFSSPANSPVAFLGYAGNNATVSASAGQPTIIPPNTTLIAKISSNVSGGANGWINFALSFAEVYIPPSIFL